VRALIFDLDGTLVDTVYAHVFAWQRAFTEAGMSIDGWKIHRRIGMSGGLFTRAAARELGAISPQRRPRSSSGATGSSTVSSFPNPDLCRARWTSCGTFARPASYMGSPPPAADPRSTPPLRSWAWGPRRWSSSGAR
jgi:hypothetical protein